MRTDKIFLVAANIPARDWSFEICAAPKVVGRGADVEIKIEKNELGVSRNHAKFWINGSHWVEDLDSSFGTFVNKVRLIPRQKTRIVVGDQILLGKMELHVVSEVGIEMMRDLEGISNADFHDTASSGSLEWLGDGATGVAALMQTIHSLLTKSEHEIIIWLMRGIVSEAEIAKRTFRSSNTIRTHMNKIYRKLNVHSRHELMALLLRGSYCESESE